MKNVKILRIFVIISIVLLFTTGCFIKDFINSQEELDANKKDATIEAKKYILKKYNFELNDDDIYSHNFERHSDNAGFTSYKTGKVTISARHNEKNFKIIVDIFKKNMDDYYDDYELDKIDDSFKEYFSEKLNINKNNLKIIFTQSLLLSNHMHDKYTDISTFLNNYSNNGHSPKFMVLTTEKLNYEDVKNSVSYFNDINDNEIVFMNISNTSLDNYNPVKQYNEMPDNLSEFQEYFEISNVYVDSYYTCRKNYCSSNELKQTKINDNIYVKTTADNQKNSQYNVDISLINIDDKLKEKIDNNIQSYYNDNQLPTNYLVYKLSFTNNEAYQDNFSTLNLNTYRVYVHENDTPINFFTIDNDSSFYHIVDKTKDNQLANKYGEWTEFTSYNFNGESYLIIVN